MNFFVLKEKKNRIGNLILDNKESVLTSITFDRGNNNL